jgi:energy-coupling factor transporter ATP-binding protein EcfA2
MIFPFGHNAAEKDAAMLSSSFSPAKYVQAAFDDSVTLLIGRRGSGKTALSMHLRKSVPSRYGVSIDLDKSQALGKVLTEADKALKGAPSIATDQIADLWEFAIVSKTMQKLLDDAKFLDYEGSGVVKDALISLGINQETKVFQMVRALFQGIGKANKPAEALGDAVLGIAEVMRSTTFERATRELRGFLGKVRVLVAIDTIEDYRVREPKVDQALAGLLQAVSRFGDGGLYPGLVLKCFFPAEVYPYILTSEAVNTRKVEESPLQLRWSVKELHTMLCRRLATWMDTTIYRRARFAEVDWSDYDEVVKVWQQFFPRVVLNRQRGQEDSFLYLARHTLLQPGQLIWLCNTVAQQAAARNFFPETIESRDIVSGVRELELRLAGDLLDSYDKVYPGIAGAIQKAFREQPNILMFVDVEKGLKRVKKYWPSDRGDCPDESELVRILLECGVLGKVKERTEHYWKVAYEYHADHPLDLDSGDRCAIHPMFYRFLDSDAKVASESRMVCPVVLLDGEE